MCVLRHHLAGHQACGAQLRLQAISFNGLWHIFPCMQLGLPSFNSDFSQQLVDCFVVKPEPVCCNSQSLRPGSFQSSLRQCRLLIRKYECLDVETFTTAYYSESYYITCIHLLVETGCGQVSRYCVQTTCSCVLVLPISYILLTMKSIISCGFLVLYSAGKLQ